MLCPGCRTTSTKKEREGGKCPKCGRPFRFDPSSPLSDAEMESIIAKLSTDGRHKFTNSQLVAETERFLLRRERKERKQRLASLTPNTVWPWVIGACALLAVVAGVWGIGAFQAWMFWVGIFGFGFLIYAARRSDPDTERRQLEALNPTTSPGAASIVHRYAGLGPIAGLLPPPRRDQPPAAIRREFDLESFGFDRVVVVQGAEMVDMLVANRFHFEHNAAVVSFDGYPRHVADLIRRQMEAGHVKATIFLLHGATPEGYVLADRWKSSDWAKLAPIVRVGLTPQQTAKLLPAEPSSRMPPAPPLLPIETGRALQERAVELSALRPRQAMTLLFNAIHGYEQRPLEDAEDAALVAYSFAEVNDVAYDFG